MLHKNVPSGDIHKIHNWEVANMAALVALSVGASDIGKVAKVTTPLGFYILTDNVGPVWTNIMSTTSITVSATEPPAPNLNDIWIQIPV